MGPHWTFLAQVGAPERRRGRPWRENRAVLNGILWILRTRCPMGGPAGPLSVASNLPSAVSAVGPRRRVANRPRNPRAGPPRKAIWICRKRSSMAASRPPRGEARAWARRNAARDRRSWRSWPIWMPLADPSLVALAIGQSGVDIDRFRCATVSARFLPQCSCRIPMTPWPPLQCGRTMPVRCDARVSLFARSSIGKSISCLWLKLRDRPAQLSRESLKRLDIRRSHVVFSPCTTRAHRRSDALCILRATSASFLFPAIRALPRKNRIRLSPCSSQRPSWLLASQPNTLHPLRHCRLLSR